MEITLLTSEVVLPVRQSSVVLKEGDGYSERTLLKKGKRLRQTLPDYVNASIETIDGEKSKLSIVNGLVVPDYNFILFELYRLNIGDELTFMNVCSACGQLNQHVVNLATLPMLSLPEGASAPPDPTLDVLLPRVKLRARVGFLTVANDTLLNEQMATSGNVDLNQEDFLSLRMLEGCDPITYEDVVRLPMKDHKALREKRRLLQAGYDPLITLECESCGNHDLQNILGLRDFLFPSG